MTVDKSLLAGSTTMLVLKLLDGQDMYGYQMIEELSRRSERAFAPLLPFGAQGATFAARKRSRMGDIYHCGRSRAERGRLPWLCLKPLPSLPAPRLSSCGGKRRDRSSKTSF